MLGPAFELSEDDHDMVGSVSLYRYDVYTCQAKKDEKTHIPHFSAAYYSSLLQMKGTATYTWPLSDLAWLPAD